MSDTRIGSPVRPTARTGSWSREAWANLREWALSLRIFLVVTALSTVGVGVPVSLIVDGQSLRDGLAIGAITGTAFFGLVALSLAAIAVVALAADWLYAANRR